MTRWQKFAGTLVNLVLAGSIVLSTTAPSLAQRPTEEQILNALKPAPVLKTRGLSIEPRRNAEEQGFINSNSNDQDPRAHARRAAKGLRYRAEQAKHRPRSLLRLQLFGDIAARRT